MGTTIPTQSKNNSGIMSLTRIRLFQKNKCPKMEGHHSRILLKKPD
jgi:hypothetical protein